MTHRHRLLLLRGAVPRCRSRSGRDSPICIPVVGSYAGAISAIVVAVFVSPLTGLLVAVYFVVVYQQFEDYVLVPRVIRGAVNLSPASVIVATLDRRVLGGFVGALLALPLAATIKVVVVEIWLGIAWRKACDDLARRHLPASGVAKAGRSRNAKTAERRAGRCRPMVPFAPHPRGADADQP